MNSSFLLLLFFAFFSTGCATVKKSVEENPKTAAGPLAATLEAGWIRKQRNSPRSLKRTEEGLVTKLKGDILFDTGKATLRPEARTNLREMASIMKKYPKKELKP